ncbi:MAG: hypothetical protein MJ236_04310 [Clostridia bacterium]|nr:hypothetical protein [Clostridia bacterium]
MYDKYSTAANPDMHLVYPDEEMQKLVTLGICNAKNTKHYNSANKEFPEKITEVCNHLVEQGVDCIVGAKTLMR